jgi:uncharacterized protein YjbI with pentapeptide repeats
MGARFRSRWQQIKTHPVGSVLIAFVTALVVLVILGGYLFHWDWAGFNGKIKSGKTLWDWMQLLFIPVVLAVAGFWFNHRERKEAELRSENERKAAELRAKTESDIAEDNQREAALKEDIDKMSELLLHEKLRESKPEDEVRTIARVRTITILFQLDARRIGYVFAFLRETGLMSEEPNSGIISLSGANLSTINLSQTNLYSVNLSGANLREANLSNARLLRAELTGANLDKANLSNTNLFFANLSEASLLEANLSGANFWGADLSRARFCGADLSNANLSDASLCQANFADLIIKKMNGASFIDTRLGGADLSGANLSGANLSKANLCDAKVTPEQLNTARSLQGATMPDGSIHP